MTDHQYWEERKKRIKLMNQAFNLAHLKGLIGGKLTEVLLAKYGKDNIIRLETSELEHFQKWLQSR